MRVKEHTYTLSPCIRKVRSAEPLRTPFSMEAKHKTIKLLQLFPLKMYVIVVSHKDLLSWDK